ncbi:MAG: ComF family protein [Verrucomicrobia bacterium]|nr:ComF family protein [Verrucomicrobiota bacterium]
MSVFGSIAARLLDLLYPRRCLVCGADLESGPSSVLCNVHRREVILVEDPMCERCGAKMFAQATGELLCAECRSTTRHFDRAFSATIYNDPMKALVHRYKYGLRQYLARPFAAWMIEFARRHIDTANLDSLVPVPLHWRRFQYRGFNQAAALAQAVGRGFGLPVVKHVLRRLRHTTPQVQLGPSERRENMKDAFAVRRAERIKGKRIILVDDVYTTGATINECARVLKKAGAASVVAFTLTRPIS